MFELAALFKHKILNPKFEIQTVKVLFPFENALSCKRKISYP